MKNSWSMGEYTALEIQANQDIKKFVVPKFQRGVVWSDRQNEDFVDLINLNNYKKYD